MNNEPIHYDNNKPAWGEKTPPEYQSYPELQAERVQLAARVRELEAQLANSAEELDSGNAARAEMESIKYAAHMPDDYPYNLATYINTVLYACYIGAKISPEVQAQIESGALIFPDAPIHKQALAAGREAGELRAELSSLSETMRAYLDSDGIACDWPYDNDNALKAIIEHCKTGWQEWEQAKDELGKLAQPQAGEAKPAGEGGNA